MQTGPDPNPNYGGTRRGGCRIPERIYVIGEAKSGPVKVGVTGHIARRLSLLQTGNPRELHIFGWMESQSAEAIEADVHKALANRHIKGEWFRVSARVACATVVAIAEARALADLGLHGTVAAPPVAVKMLCQRCSRSAPVGDFSANGKEWKICPRCRQRDSDRREGRLPSQIPAMRLGSASEGQGSIFDIISEESAVAW